MDPDDVPKLAERERDILVAWLTGTSNSVAQKLQISPATARTHLIRIQKKYQAAGRPARTRAELFQRAVEDGMIDPGLAEGQISDPDNAGPSPV